jgi:N-acetylmuramoyl-L-alanine amidase
MLKAEDIANVEYLEKYSPHFNDRPRAVHGIIIHACGEYIGGVWAPEFMEKYRLSYHGMIEPSGRVVVTVPRSKRAWHAGLSMHQGERNLNDTYIGFCLMLAGDWSGQKFIDAMNQPDAYTQVQKDSLILLGAQAVKDYPAINATRIVGHQHVSGPSVRTDPKHDPGDGLHVFDIADTIMRVHHGR